MTFKSCPIKSKFYWIQVSIIRNIQGTLYKILRIKQKTDLAEFLLQGLLNLCGYASATIAEFISNTLTGFALGQQFLRRISP